LIATTPWLLKPLMWLPPTVAKTLWIRSRRAARPLHRAGDGLHGGLHVDHHAAPQPLAGGGAADDHVQRTAGQQLGDGRSDARGADVESDEELCFLRH
jgi:hypothetical protein